MEGVMILKKVLFVCLGNICRSPMAESILRDQIRRNNLEHEISVDSAGTGGWHTNQPPHEGTRKLLDKYGISYKGQTARQVRSGDFSEFDYIIAMDAQNIKDLEDIVGADTDKITRLTDYIDHPSEADVPDPYYTGDFDYTYELISQGCHGILNHIRIRHDI